MESKKTKGSRTKTQIRITYKDTDILLLPIHSFYLDILRKLTMFSKVNMTWLPNTLKVKKIVTQF